MATRTIIFKGDLKKLDAEKKIAYGWAYVAKKDDQVVVDHSGQSWPIEEVEKTAHKFVSDCRVGGEMHITKGGAELVESIVFTKAVQKALGIDLGMEGWFVGFQINDDALLEKIEKGELCMFSIGGTGIVEEIEDAA